MDKTLQGNVILLFVAFYQYKSDLMSRCNFEAFSGDFQTGRVLPKRLQNQDGTQSNNIEGNSKQYVIT